MKILDVFLLTLLTFATGSAEGPVTSSPNTNDVSVTPGKGHGDNFSANTSALDQKAKSQKIHGYEELNRTLVINGTTYRIYIPLPVKPNEIPLSVKPNDADNERKNLPSECILKNITGGGLKVRCVNISIYEIADELPSDTTFLDLKWMNDSRLEKGILSHLSQLEHLKITHSHVRFVLSHFFTGLHNLRSLDLEGNWISVLSKSAFTSTPNLEYFSMRGNMVSNIASVTSAIKILEKLEIFDLSNNLLLERVMSNSFSPLVNRTLRELSLAECQIRRIDKDAFQPLRKLQVLDVGSNPFETESLRNLTSSLQWMDIRSLGLSFLPRVRFSQTEFMPLRLTPLEDLDLSFNHLLQIPDYAFANLTNLKMLNLRGCGIELIDPQAFYNLKSLRTLDLQENKIYYVSSAITSLKNLRELKLNNYQRGARVVKFALRENQLSSLVKLEYLSLSLNPIEDVIKKNDFAGLFRLRGLMLYGCGLTGIADYAFSDLWSLTKLDLSYNVITNISKETFYGLHSLQLLNLKGNTIFFGPFVSPFLHLPSLQSLLLSHNKLSILYTKMFVGLQNLSLLHLSNNVIKPWSHPVLSSLPKLEVLVLYTNEISHVTETMLGEFQDLKALDMHSNPFKCDACGMKEFQDWLMTTNTTIASRKYNDTYDCASPLQLAGLSIFNVTIPTDHCQIKVLDIVLVATISVVIPLMLIGGFAFAAYYLRWYIRYYVFLLRTHVHKYRALASTKTYEFDAFVSYCATESKWVIDQLVPTLESQNCNLKLCLHDRDFEVGRLITDNIMQSIEMSRKTVLILSEAYVSSKWCMLELHMAQHRLFDDIRDALVLVELKELDKNSLPKALKYLMKTRTYIPWTTNPIGQKLFWEKLKDALRKPDDSFELKQIV